MKNTFQKTLLATAIAATSVAANAAVTVDANTAGAAGALETWFMPKEDLRTQLAITTGAATFGDTNSFVAFTPSADSTADLVVTLNNAIFTQLTAANNTYTLCEVDATGLPVANGEGLSTVNGTVNVNTVTFANVNLLAANRYAVCRDTDTTDTDLTGTVRGFGLTLTADQQAAGSAVTINFNYGNGTLNNDTATILSYENGLRATVAGAYDDTIDAIFKDALSFGTGAAATDLMDTLSVTIAANTPTSKVTATNAPAIGTEVTSLTYSIAGLDQAAVNNVTLDRGVGNTDVAFTKSNGNYVLTSNLFQVGTDVINTYVNGTSQITATNMTVNVRSNPAAGFASTIDYGTLNAGAWALNGLQAKVAYIPVGYETINPIIKIANESAINGKVFIAANGRNITDGENFTVARTLSDVVISGNSVGTLTNDQIVEALGLDADKQYQLQLDLLVTGPINSVHVTAQYKDEAVAGRVAVPVLYNRADTWTQ